MAISMKMVTTAIVALKGMAIQGRSEVQIPTIKDDVKLTQVGGMPPVKYMQDGHAFDDDGNCLGPCDDTGKLVDQEKWDKFVKFVHENNSEDDEEKPKRSRSKKTKDPEE